jgi:hypothetical protein
VGRVSQKVETTIRRPKIVPVFLLDAGPWRDETKPGPVTNVRPQHQSESYVNT